MRKRMKIGRPSNATVIACLALFAALGSGAYAAGGFSGKEKKQVKKIAKTYSKRFSRKFAKRGPAGPQGPQGLQGPQGPPGPSNVTTMSFTNDESCSPALPLPSGVTSSRPVPGVCVLTFPGSVSNCTGNATVHYRLTGLVLLTTRQRSAELFTQSEQPNQMAVDTYQEGARVNLPFDLVLVC